MREADTVRLRDKPEKCSIAVEAPRSALFNHFETRLVMSVKDLFGDPARRRPVNECKGIGAMPLNAYNGNRIFRKDSPDSGVRLKIFEFQMGAPVLRLWAEVKGASR